jgi:hypothetical protein
MNELILDLQADLKRINRGQTTVSGFAVERLSGQFQDVSTGS